MKTKLSSQPNPNVEPRTTSLLVPTDFTEASHRAFEYALSLAEAINARITLLHVYQDPKITGDKVHWGFSKALEEEAMEKAMKYFHEYQREAQLSLSKKIEVQPMLTKGYTAHEIIHATQNLQIDWIVMSTEGAVSAKNHQGGSIAQYLIGHTECPLLLIPAEANYQPIEHISYAMSFQEKDFPVLDTLIDLTTQLDAKLSCVHIRNNPSGWDEIDLDLYDRLNALSQKDNPLNFYFLNHPDIVQGLKEYVCGNKVDVLAMLTHDHPGAGYTVKSLTREMGLYTDIPMLVYHA